MNRTHKTAIARNKPSKPMAWLFGNGYVHHKRDKLDYGCGKGFDADNFSMDKYDPHFYPTEPVKQYDLITCNYVLNVIPDEFSRNQVVRDIQKLLNDNGHAYISVRCDVKYDTDTQFRVKLDLPILFQDSRVCIYTLDKTTQLKEIEHEEIRA